MYLAIHASRPLRNEENLCLTHLVGLVRNLCFLHSLKEEYFFPAPGSVVFRLSGDYADADSLELAIGLFFVALHSSLPSLVVSDICPFTTYKQFQFLNYTFQLKQTL